MVQDFGGFISSAASCAPERGEQRFCRAQLSCRHVRICFQLRPVTGLGGGRGARRRGFAFFTALFLSCSTRLRCPCLQKLKFKTSWRKLPRGAGGMPRRFPRRRSGFHRAPSGSAGSHEPHAGRRLLDQLRLLLGLSQLLPEELWEILLQLSWKCDAPRKALG